MPVRGTRRVASHPATHRATFAIAVLAIAVAAFFLGGRLLARPAAPLDFGQALQITSDPGLAVQPAISPDGHLVAYAAGTSGGTRIYVRQVSGGRANPLTNDSTASQEAPQWSPDGSRILFLQAGGAFSAPASGGLARQEVPGEPHHVVTSAAWAPDGQRIAYVVSDSLFIRAGDGHTGKLAQISGAAMCTWSPRATLIACASGNPQYLSVGPRWGNLSPARVVVCRVSDGTASVVSDSTSVNESPVWSPDGRWLYYVSNRRGRGDIYAQRLTSTGHASDQPIRLTTGLGAQSISVSRDGFRFAYGVYAASANVWAMPIPMAPPVSAATAVPMTTGTQVVENLRVSRDGKWLLFDSTRPGNADIYRIPAAGGEPERLTTDPNDDFSPDLSPDDREVAFHSWRAGSRDIYVQPLDGRPIERVTSSPDQELDPIWSPDGSAIVYKQGAGDVGASIWIVRRSADGTWGTPFERVEDGQAPDWSPDGSSLVYLTAHALVVAPADSGAGRTILDSDAPGVPTAELPHWSDDGRTIYFKSHNANGYTSVWSIAPRGGSPRLLVTFTDPARQSYRQEWAAGAGRFYFPIQERQSDVWVIDAVRR